MEDQKEGVSDVWFQNELAKYPKARCAPRPSSPFPPPAISMLPKTYLICPQVRADDWVGPLPREATAKVPPSPPSSSSSLPSATKPNQKNSRLPNHPSSSESGPAEGVPQSFVRVLRPPLFLALERSVHPFWSALRQELSIYYSEEDVEKIVDAFEGDYKRSVSSWSLDDIERVATALS